MSKRKIYRVTAIITLFLIQSFISCLALQAKEVSATEPRIIIVNKNNEVPGYVSICLAIPKNMGKGCSWELLVNNQSTCSGDYNDKGKAFFIIFLLGRTVSIS